MKHLNVLALGGAALVLLSACGGSSYHGNGTSYSPPPAVQGDAFTASVQSTIATAPEDVEPISVETIVATEVDDKEPEAVM
jgi:hypothetical protein